MPSTWMPDTIPLCETLRGVDVEVELRRGSEESEPEGGSAKAWKKVLHPPVARKQYDEARTRCVDVEMLVGVATPSVKVSSVIYVANVKLQWIK